MNQLTIERAWRIRGSLKRAVERVLFSAFVALMWATTSILPLLIVWLLLPLGLDRFDVRWWFLAWGAFGAGYAWRTSGDERWHF